MKLAAVAIRRPVTTTMFFLGTALLGLISLGELQLELLPEVVFPEIYVQLTRRAMSPEQVERELLQPAEGAVGTIEGVAGLESSASPGRALLRIIFAPESDMRFALLQVQSRMDRLQPSLPELTQIAVQRFDTSQLSTAVMDVQILGEGDLNWLREFTELNIRPELEAIDGVVGATPLGGQRRAIEVILDREAMEAYRISPSELRRAIDSVNRPRAYLGEVYDRSAVYPVSIQGQFTTLQQIRNVMVDATIPLRLSDIARVQAGLQRRTDLNRVNGLSAVSVRILKEDEANLIDVADAVVARVEGLNAELAPAGVQLLVTNSQADLMQGALGTLVQAAAVGLLLGLIVLFLFLRNLRFVAVLIVSIPTSLLLTFNLMYAWGLSLNVLSLCGLALAMGLLADNGIVVMESVFKQYERGKPPAQAALDGTTAVSRAVVASTATTATVFLPVVFIQSDFQDILRDLAMSITFPLSVSLLVALTLVPMLGSRTLDRTRLKPMQTGRLLSMYTVLLKASLRHRAQVAIFIGVAFAVTLIAAFFLMLQRETVQTESQFTVYVELPDGSTLDATDEVARGVETAVAELEGIDGFTTSVQDTQASITVELLAASERPDGASVSDLQVRLAQSFDRFNDAVVGYDPPASATGGGGGRGGDRTGGFGLGGAGGEMAIVRGQDLATLQMIAEDLSFRLGEIEEIDFDSIRADAERSGPEVQIVPDPVAMFDRRIELGTVLAAIGDSDVEGFATSTAFLEPDGTETVIEVRPVEDPETEGLRVDDLRVLPVVAPSGATTPLYEVARVRTDEGRRSILRTDQTRRIVVDYNFTDEVLESQPRLDAARGMARAVAQGLALPDGYTIETVEATVETVYYWMMGIAALLVYMILASLLESFTSPVVVFCTLPTAAIGACWALIFSGMGLTSQAGPMALLGLVVLIGIAVNNGIILIDTISNLRQHHGYSRERAVLTAGRTRVRPILMTSATTLLGVLPLALEFGGDYEIWPPFAMTILGGLSVSMVSTLIFIPVAYMGIGQVTEWLRDLGWVGVGFSIAAAGLATYGIDVRYQSTFWTSLLAVPLWLLALSLVWLVESAHRSRVAARRSPEPIRSIRLNTLTKIYGAPGRLRHEWGRFERRAQLRMQQGLEPIERGPLAQSLSWKVPLLALAIALDLYVTDFLWIFLFGLATWGLLLHVGWCLAVLWLPRSLAAGRLAAAARALARIAPAVGFFVYIQARMGLTSVTVAAAAFWIGSWIIRGLAGRLQSGRVDLDNLGGRVRWLRRAIYLGVSRVPWIGARRRPFRALSGVSLEIGRGMFGLLGPNGAGKTTLMRIVCQVLDASHGTVAINGRSQKEFGYTHGVIGYLPQKFGLYDHMSARDYLEYRALLEGFRDEKERLERVQWCVEQVHLADRQDDLIGSYSGGMKQRVGIAQTLLHAPAVIVVDEPTAGLDPVERIRFRNLLARLSQDRIVIFSTHIVEDIAGSCNQLAVLDGGRLRYTGTPEAMRQLAEGMVWETLVDADQLEQLESSHKVVNQLRTRAGTRARFLAKDPGNAVSATSSEPTLEDAYVFLLEQQRGMA